MANIELDNADKFVELAKKYNYNDVSEMLNDNYDIIEWGLFHDVIIEKEIQE